MKAMNCLTRVHARVSQRCLGAGCARPPWRGHAHRRNPMACPQAHFEDHFHPRFSGNRAGAETTLRPAHGSRFGPRLPCVTGRTD
jgi:hypothetical protein